MGFFVRNIWNYVKFARRKNKNIFRDTIQEKATTVWQIFDDSGTFAQNNVNIQTNVFLFNFWKQS